MTDTKKAGGTKSEKPTLTEEKRTDHNRQSPTITELVNRLIREGHTSW